MFKERLMLVIKWKNNAEITAVYAPEANERCPQLVIEFYEKHSEFVR